MLLDCVEPEKIDEHNRMIQYLTRREIWRTKRMDEVDVHQLAERMFPMPDEFDALSMGIAEDFH